MRIGYVPITEVIGEGGRLTGAFHLSEDQRAVATVRRARLPKKAVAELVQERGVFRGPIFSRRFVDGPEYGEPYVSAKDLMTAEVRPAAYLSRTHGPLLETLRLRRGMILVTCSGMNLGRVIWCRADLDGLVASHDLIRICPDGSSVPPGYLFAFLASRYGHSLIRKEIYGGHIKHIEPDHIADLPVPRLGDEIERRAHDLVEMAAGLRSKAAALRNSAVSQVTAALKWVSRPANDLWTTAGPSLLQRRMDAFHHAAGIAAARKCLARRPSMRLRDVVAEVFEPNRGARRKVEDAAHGVQFLSSSEVFRLDPVADYLISRSRTPNIERHLVGETDLLLPRSGQLGGIIGRAVLPLPSYYGSAASEHLVRVRCRSREDAFFGWAIFATEPGYYAAIGTAFGSSIPSLDCALLAELRVPWWEGPEREEIVSIVEQMVNALAEAIVAERSGVALVERAIEEAA